MRSLENAIQEVQEEADECRAKIAQNVDTHLEPVEAARMYLNPKRETIWACMRAIDTFVSRSDALAVIESMKTVEHLYKRAIDREDYPSNAPVQSYNVSVFKTSPLDASIASVGRIEEERRNKTDTT